MKTATIAERLRAVADLIADDAVPADGWYEVSKELSRLAFRVEEDEKARAGEPSEGADLTAETAYKVLALTNADDAGNVHQMYIVPDAIVTQDALFRADDLAIFYNQNLEAHDVIRLSTMEEVEQAIREANSGATEPFAEEE